MVGLLYKKHRNCTCVSFIYFNGSFPVERMLRAYFLFERF